MNVYYIVRIEGGELWGLTAKNLMEASLKLDHDKRTAGRKRVLHFRVNTPDVKELSNLSEVNIDGE